MPFTKENIPSAVRLVLIEHGNIGYWFLFKNNVGLWNEIHLIRSTYSRSFSQVLPSQFAVTHNSPTAIVSKVGNKIPEKLINNLQIFFTTCDPNETIKATPTKMKGPTDYNMIMDLNGFAYNNN